MVDNKELADEWRKRSKGIIALHGGESEFARGMGKALQACADEIDPPSESAIDERCKCSDESNWDGPHAHCRRERCYMGKKGICCHCGCTYPGELERE